MSTIDLTSFRQVEDRQDGFVSYKLRKKLESFWSVSMAFKQLQNHFATRKKQKKRNTQNEHHTLGDVACQTHYRLTYNCTLRSD